MHKLILLSIFVTLITGCFPQNGSLNFEVKNIADDMNETISPNPITTPIPSPTPGQINSYFSTAYKNMETMGCFSCHTSGYLHGDLKNLTEESDWVNANLIKPGQPDNSFLIQKLKLFKSSVSTMPPDDSLTQEIYDQLRLWITHVAPVEELPPSSSDNQFEVIPQVLGIQHFIAQQKKLFWKENDANSAFMSMSNHFRKLWGGGCDFYESTIDGISSNKPVMENPDKSCDPKNSLNTGPEGVLSIIKAGSRMNLCDYFPNSDSSMDVFYSKGFISGKTFNKANAEKIFHLYYPHLQFTDAIYNNFVNTTKSVHSNIVGNNDLQWRVYLSTLCQSLYWEIL